MSRFNRALAGGLVTLLPAVRSYGFYTQAMREKAKAGYVTQIELVIMENSKNPLQGNSSPESKCSSGNRVSIRRITAALASLAIFAGVPLLFNDGAMGAGEPVAVAEHLIG